MTRIDIFSGFLGAGKTTLIKKLIKEAYQGEQLVLIENEFGEIGIDGGFLKESGIRINEMNSGCICCSLVGDFGAALKQVIHEYHPDRILIEPSGVGKLSDVIRAVQNAAEHEAVLGSAVCVADATKVKLYMKNFGEFYNNQIETAACIILSRTGGMNEEKLAKAVELIRGKNDKATLVTTAWDELTGAQLLSAMENTETLAEELRKLAEEAEHEHHHHHDDDDDECDDPDCACHHHHDDEDEDEHEHHHHHHDDEDEDEHEHHHHHDDEDEAEHEHHHHDDDDDECDDPDCACHHHHDDDEEHEHHHHHDGDDDECDDPDCACHHHDDEEEHEHHHHHHHHHADEVFTSWGKVTTKKFTEDGIRQALEELDDTWTYGMGQRAKGIVQAEDGRWVHFDHVPGEVDVRYGTSEVIGRLCVIGSKLDTDEIEKLFGV